MGPNILHVFTDNTFLFYFGLWTYSIHLKGVHGKRSQSYFVFITVLQSLKVRAVKTCFQVGTETQSYQFAVTNKRKSCPPWKWHLQGRGEQSQTNGEERTYTETGGKESRKREAETGSIHEEIHILRVERIRRTKTSLSTTPPRKQTTMEKAPKQTLVPTNRWRVQK